MENTAILYAAKIEQLNNILVEAVAGFADRNPDIPAQILMAGLGELLLRFSLSQLGTAPTQSFLNELKEAVVRFEGQKLNR